MTIDSCVYRLLNSILMQEDNFVGEEIVSFRYTNVRQLNEFKLIDSYIF